MHDGGDLLMCGMGARAVALWAIGLGLLAEGPAWAQSANEVKATSVYQVGSAGAASNLLPVSATHGSGDGLLTATTATTYDAVGNVLTVDGPLPGPADTTRYVWDAMRQQVGVIGPDPDGAGPRLFPATRMTYNANGQVVMVEQGVTTGQTDAAWAGFSVLQTATTDYNAQGRKVRDTVAVGTPDVMATQYSYDAAGRLICTAQRMNPAVYGALPPSACTPASTGAFGPDRIAHNTYDAAGQLLSTTRGYLSSTPITESQTWTANGKVATRTDGNGNVSTYVYDGYDRVSRLRYPNASGGGSSTTDYESWGYDAAGNVTAYRNRGGETFGYVFDALNRKTQTIAPASVSSVSYTYDNLGRQLTASAGAQTLSSTWDALSRMTSATGPLGTTGYGYDLAGRRTSLHWPDGFWIAYDHDLAGAVTAIRENGATNWQLASWSYDNLGRRTAQGRANGAVTGWSYDAAGRLSGLSHDMAGTAHDLTLGFTRNPASQIVTRSVSNAAYQDTPAAGQTDYVNNGRNQVTSVGGTAVGYDGRWNITSAAGGTYGYNALNQLVSAATGGAATTLAYDPADRLQQLGSTRFLYDGPHIIGEYDASGGVLRRYVHGVGPDEPITVYEGAGYDRRWLLADERGSIVAVTDGAGAAVAVNTYDEYGRPGPGNVGRFQYTGQMWLPEAQAYHYKARIYAPTLGRFLQTDPIGYGDGLNVYAYVANDPVNNTDPDGRQTVAGISRMTRYWQAAGRAAESAARTAALRAGEALQGRGAMAVIRDNEANIEISSARNGVDPDLQRGIIFEEQSHQLPPGEGLLERGGLGVTIGLGQVTVGTGGFTREQLFDPAQNIEASSGLLGSIAKQDLIDPARPDASIATRYNCGTCESITPYGTRVETYTNQFRRMDE